MLYLIDWKNFRRYAFFDSNHIVLISFLFSDMKVLTSALYVLSHSNKRNDESRQSFVVT